MPIERVSPIRIRGLWRMAGVLLALIVSSGIVLAQGHRGEGRHGPSGPQRRGRRMGPMMRRGPDQHPHQPGFLKRLRDLPPEEQERVLANDERFQRLPPERQQRIREHLRRWNGLSRQEKDRIHERQEIFEGLSPAQRQQARELFPQWRQMAPERRQVLLQAFRRLRDLPPDERQRFLSSSETQKRFSPEERRLLEGLSGLLPGSRRGVAED